MLRMYLGPARQWRDFLADSIRGRGALHGLTLLPYAAREGGSNQVPRPLYRATEVVAFIRDVRLRDPSLRPASITLQHFELDTTPGLPWRMRIARPRSGGTASL